MKILMIIGSPRKKDTFEAAGLLEAEMKKLGPVEFEYLHLAEYDVMKCTGCHGCINKEGFLCPVAPDLGKILEKMETADGLVLASPVYANTVTTLMKSYMDHLSYLWHRPRFHGKKAMTLVVGGGTFGYIEKYMELNLNRWGYDVAAKAGLPHLDALNDKYKAKALKKLGQSAEQFYSEVKDKKRTVPRLIDLIWFNIWKGNATMFQKTLKEDYKYWEEKGWTKASYYYPTRIALWKKVMVWGFNKLGDRFMKGIYKVE